MDLIEGLYGTTRSSYYSLPGAKLIIRHSKKIDPEIPGSRGRCIESIFVQNGFAKRFLFPTKHLAPARAMASHLNHGGAFADAIGAQITRMAKDYSDLATVATHVRHNADSLGHQAMDVREGCRGHMRGLRQVFESMCRPTLYEAQVAALASRAALLESNAGSLSKEKIDELRNILTVEGKELDESVLETTVRAFEDMLVSPSKAKEGHGKEEIEEAEDNGPQIGVLGTKLLKSVWDKFKEGKLELVRRPEFHSMTRYTSKTDEIAGKLAQIVPIVSDNGMMNLLSKVADKLSSGDVPRDDVQHYIAVARSALKAIGQNTSSFAANTAPVKEFRNWLHAFDTEAILAEDSETFYGIDEKDDFPEDPDDNFVDLGLSREDILMPSGDQGDSLKKEITPPIEVDPKDGNVGTADRNYINTLQSNAFGPRNQTMYEAEEDKPRAGITKSKSGHYSVKISLAGKRPVVVGKIADKRQADIVANDAKKWIVSDSSEDYNPPYGNIIK